MPSGADCFGRKKLKAPFPNKRRDIIKITKFKHVNSIFSCNREDDNTVFNAILYRVQLSNKGHSQISAAHRISAALEACKI